MNIPIISGSRNPEGQTARAAKALMQGVIEIGGSSEVVFLPQESIERCRQCDDNGWGLCIREGKCVIDDDLSTLVDRMKAADAVVFATPVYFSDLSESLKALLDRVRRTCRHEASKDGIAGKPAVGICVAGGGGGGAPACCVILEKVLATCGFDVVDMVPARRQNLDHKLGVLKATGAWLAKVVTSNE